MNKNDLDKVYSSLLKCFVGTISTLDVLNLRQLYDETELVEFYMYNKALEDHCGMSMYDTGDIH